MANAQTLDTLDSLKTDEQLAQTQYAETLKTCANKLAPAQCKRQAGLDFNQAKHAVKIKRDALSLRTRQEKQAQHVADMQSNHDPAVAKLTPTNTSRPERISKPVGAKKEKSSPEKLTPKSKPPKMVHRNEHLSTQPMATQRSTHALDTARKQAHAAERQQATVTKANKRIAKDAARRAAGYTVDKP